MRSHNNAERAIKEGDFKGEIVSIEIKDRKGNVTMVVTDEHFRPELTMEDLARHPPVFKKNDTVTAGNSSGINDVQQPLFSCPSRRPMN